MSITDFLLARIAEDEAAARAASDALADDALKLASGEGAAAEALEHFDRWLPARVLAGCEAKRRIVERSSRPVAHAGQDVERQVVLRLLAAVYAGHQDYDEGWRP